MPQHRLNGHVLDRVSVKSVSFEQLKVTHGKTDGQTNNKVSYNGDFRVT